MSQAGSTQDHSPGFAAPQDSEARHVRLRSEVVEGEWRYKDDEIKDTQDEENAKITQGNEAIRREEAWVHEQREEGLAVNLP